MPTTERSAWLLGLDMGTDSLGWAAFRLEAQSRPCRLLDGGVRLFDWGRHPRSNESRESERGAARRARRRLKARAWRRERLRELLCAVLELDSFPDVPKDVWLLRARSALQPIAAADLAVVLMHMARHRGFKSIRLGAEVSDRQKRESNQELGRWDEYDRHLRNDMAAGDHRTVGGLLADRLSRGMPVRARQGQGYVPSRTLIGEEFETIRSCQSHLGLRSEDWQAISSIMFDQRPLGVPTRALCSGLPELREPRMAAAMPSVQCLLVRMTVANLRVRAGDFRADRLLEPAEFQALTAHLDEGGVHSWASLRKVVGLAKKGVKFSIEQDRPDGAAKAASRETKGDSTTAVMKEFMPTVWGGMSLRDRDAFVAALLDHRRDRQALKSLGHARGVPDAELERFADAVQFRLPRGTIAYGKTAVARLLEEIAPGRPLHEAEERAFDRKHGERRAVRCDRLPYYGEAMPTRVVGANHDPAERDDEKRFGRIRNVTVHIALNETRKIVNRLIDRFGCPPVRIVVETTRELNAGAEQLGKLRTLQAKQEKANRDDDLEIAEALSDLAETALISPPQRRQRFRMFRRQRKLCPYCGQRMAITDLFGPTIHVDHVVPRSKGGPGDMSNLVVCHQTCNLIKGDQTPWTAFRGIPERWRAVQDFVASLDKQDETLKRRFGEAAERQDDGEFLPRADRDTSYMARAAMDYLKVLGTEHRPVDVVATRGGQTAYLRGAWGLPKWREDVAHHFIDAAVIAVTDRSLIQWLNTWHGRLGRLPMAGEADVPLPYETFEAEIWAKHRRLIPSIRPDRSVDEKGRPLSGPQGSLHRDMLYGLKENGDGTARLTRRRSVDSLFRDPPPAKPPKRKDDETAAEFEERCKGKPVSDAKKVEAIINSFVSERFRSRFRRAMERSRLENPNAGRAELALAAACDPGFGPRGVGKIRCYEEDHSRPSGEYQKVRRGNAGAVIDTNSNFWADIRQLGNGRWELTVVSHFEAATATGEKSSPGPDRHLMRLYRRDAVAWEQQEENGQTTTRYGWIKSLDAGNRRIYVWPMRISEGVDPKKDAESASSDRPGRIWALECLKNLRVPDRNGRSFTAETFRAAKGRPVTVTELGRLRDPGPYRSAQNPIRRSRDRADT